MCFNRFKKEWLKNGYSSKSKVNADPNLSDKERKALLGVHERHGLAKSPSEMDIKLLKGLYIGVAGDMDIESDESNLNIIICIRSTNVTYYYSL